MRYALSLIVALYVALSPDAARARDYPWCAQYDWTLSNCGFDTFQQCVATISGIGGYCRRNPFYRAEREKPRQRQRYRERDR